MLFPSYNRILWFPLMSSSHGPNKVVLDPSCTWIRCIRISSWYSNEPFNSDLVETFKTNTFNVFVLDWVIGPFGTCNGSLLVFLGWFASSPLSSKEFNLESIFVGRASPFPIVLVPRYKLSLCHTPINPDLLGFPGIGVLKCGLRDHVIKRFASLIVSIWIFWVWNLTVVSKKQFLLCEWPLFYCRQELIKPFKINSSTYICNSTCSVGHIQKTALFGSITPRMKSI